MSWVEATMRWYAVLFAVTWALAPAIAWLCDRLDDRGVTVARPLTVLAAIYPAWLLASIGLAAFSPELIAATVVLAALLSWVFMVRHQKLNRDYLRQLAIAEIASALLFGTYVWLHGYTPQILGTEKPMDIAFLASSARAVAMPPLDPWFAGEPINYYYLGYLIHATVGRLAGVSPETGFNLALATVFSTTVVAAFGVARNVVRPRLGRRLAVVSGLVAAFAVAVSGNLYAPLRLIQDAPATISASWWDSAIGIGWRSSRIVCDGPRVDNLCLIPATETINEFPYFSFLLGDLHPHVMALPYSVAAIALAWNLARHRRENAVRWDRSWLIRVALSGAVVGALYPLNAWDFPTYLMLMAGGVWGGAGSSLNRAWLPIALLGISGLLTWLPFLTTYVPPTAVGAASVPAFLERLPVVPSVLAAVALHAGERTSLAEYLTIFGVPFAFGVALILTGSIRDTEAFGQYGPRALLIAGIATVVPGVLLSAPVIPLCGIPLALAIAQLLRTPPVSPRAFALFLFACAWALSIAVEIFYIRDAFDDRMNTLFKVYYQAWTMYAVAAAVTVAVLWMAAAAIAWQRALVAGGTIVALAAGVAYPAVATYQWTERFTSWQGLDGLSYAEAIDPGEVAAIRWLARHAQPRDVVLEAAGCSYYPFGRLPFDRVSAFTGVPTVIGWGNHERQWRGGQPARIAEIGERQSDVSQMFADPMSPLFDDYGVAWLFVGEYEAGDWQSDCETAGPYDTVRSAGYPGPGWDEVFTSGNTRLYRRQGD